MHRAPSPGHHDPRPRRRGVRRPAGARAGDPGAVGDLSTSLSGVGATTALRLSLEVSLAATAPLAAVRGAARVDPGARGRSPGGRSCARWSCCRSCCRRSSAAIGLLNALGRSGVVGQWLYDGARDPAHVHDLGRDHRDDVRVDAARRARHRSGAPLARPALREGGDHARGLPGCRRCAAWSCRCSRPRSSPAPCSAWARALGEFGATITFAGNLAGRTQTLPLAVYQARQTDPGGAIFLSLILVVISVVVLVAMRDHLIEGALTWDCEPTSPSPAGPSSVRARARSGRRRDPRAPRTQRRRQDHGRRRARGPRRSRRRRHDRARR